MYALPTPPSLLSGHLWLVLTHIRGRYAKNTVRCILRGTPDPLFLAPYFLVQIGLIYTTSLKFVRPNNYYSPNNYRKKALELITSGQFWKFTTVCLSPSGPVPCYPIPVSFHPFCLQFSVFFLISKFVSVIAIVDFIQTYVLPLILNRQSVLKSSCNPYLGLITSMNSHSTP